MAWLESRPGQRALSGRCPAAASPPVQIPQLKLKWAFGFPNATTARAQPTIVGGRVFVGSQDGTVYSLDAKTGCIVWTFKARAGVRTGIVIGPRTVGDRWPYFGEARSNVYAVNAATGEQRLDANVDERIRAPTSPVRRRCTRIGCTCRSHPAKRDRATTKLRVLHVPRQPRRPRPATGNAGLEDVHDQRRSRARSAATPAAPYRWGPAGARHLVVADHRRRSATSSTRRREPVYGAAAAESSDAIIAFDLDTGKLAGQRR